MAVSLTHFSGFSGISIDFLDSQDVKNNELTAKLDRFFNSILSARLISILDFVFAIPEIRPRPDFIGWADADRLAYCGAS